MEPVKAYACYLKDDNKRMNSSSGAVFSALSSYIFSVNGVVYGVAMADDCCSAVFISVTDEEGLKKLRGSKYLQAKIGDTYKNVKKDLLDGKTVLFTGTGCQINGLKNFLQKDYNNLICVDVICHGVPSPELWRKYVYYQEKKNKGKLEYVNFRCKDESWTNFGMKEIIQGKKLKKKFISINDIPGALPEGRTKPWGTGQAVLAAKNVLHTPFIVINADDYYGKEGFKAFHEYLVNGGKSCMAGFVLKNTLSDNGGVTRGICKMDDSNNLTKVDETKNIVKTENGAEADGVIIDIDSLVSMNMWGLTQDFLEVLEDGFKEFFETEVSENPLKSEYLIPTFIGELLEQDRISVKVLRSNDTWYGMTYKEDVEAVKNSFRKMLEDGMYKEDLFADL